MRNTRLSALLSQHVTTTGLESDATPADAAAEIPAADEASPVVEEAPASEETTIETPTAPAEEITEAAAPATEDATPADDAGVIVASGDNTAPVDEATAPVEAAPAAEETPVVEESAVVDAPAEEVVVETAAELPSDVPADAVVEQAPALEDVASMEGWGGAVRNYLLNIGAVYTGALVGGAAGTVAGPAGTVAGAAAGSVGASVAFANHTAKKALTLKKQIEDITNRIADAKNGDLEDARKKGAKLQPHDVELDGKEVLKKTLMGTFIPFYNAYNGHKIEEMQKELQKKLDQLKIVLESKGIATESVIQEAWALEAAGVDPTAQTDEERQAEIEALRSRLAELETPAATPSQEGEGDEVVVATPEQDAAQGEAEAVVAAQADAETAADETPIAEEPVATETPAEAAPIEEAVEAAPAVESPSYEEVAVDDSDLNEALADQAEAEGEVKEVEETHDQLKRAADSLESIALSMESALNDGGLHPQAAKFMQIAVESQLNAIGVEQPVIPSLESFGGMSARMRATQVSLEGIKETIAKVWEQIVAILKKLRDAAIAFFKRVFTSVGRLRDYLEALEKKLETTGDKTSTIELVVPAALANRLAIGEKLPRDLAGAIEDIVAVALDSTEFDKEVAEQLKKDHDAVVDAVATGDAEAAAKIMKNFARIPKSFKFHSDKDRFNSAIQGKRYATKELAGRVEIVLIEAQMEVLGVQLTGFSTATWREDAAFNDDVKMPMLSKSDIKKIIAASKQACVAVGAMEHIADGEFKNATATAADLKIDGKTVSDHVQLNNLLNAYRQRGKVLMQLSQRIAGHAVATAGAAAKVAHMAVEQYEAK